MQQDPTFKFATNFTCSFRHLVIKNSVLAGSPMHFSNADTASFLLLFSFINRLTICRYQNSCFGLGIWSAGTFMELRNYAPTLSVVFTAEE